MYAYVRVCISVNASVYACMHVCVCAYVDTNVWT